MKFFKHNKKNDYEDYSYESKDVSGTNPGEFDDDTFTMPLDICDSGITTWGKRANKSHAPHCLTAEELMGTDKKQTSEEKIKMVSASEKTSGSNMSPAAQSLFEKMLKAQEKISAVEPEMQKIEMKGPSVAPNLRILEKVHETPVSAAKPFATQAEIEINHTLDVMAPLVSEKTVKCNRIVDKLPISPANIPMSQTSNTSPILSKTIPSNFTPRQVVEEPIESLLKKCQNFINADDEMHTYKPTAKPTYTLESVNDIISSAEKKAQDRISRIYGEKKSTFGNPVALNGNSVVLPEKSSTIKEPEPLSVEKISMTPLVNVRKSRYFETPSDTENATVLDSIAKEVPTKIKVIDSTTTSDVLTQSTDLPKNSPSVATEAKSQNIDNEIQFSLSDKSVVDKPTGIYDSTSDIDIKTNQVTPAHALFNNGKTIKSELLDQLDNDFGQTIDFAPVEKAIEHPKKFNLFGNSEEDSDDGDVIKSKYDDELEDSINDYTCLDDAPEIRIDLLSCKQKLFARIIPTALITIALLVMNSALCNSFASELGTIWGGVQLGLLLIAAIINLNTMKGLGGLFTLNPDMDSPAALAVLAVVLQAGSSFLLFNGANNELCAVATLGLTFNGIGKLIIISRVITSFGNISNSNIKRAIKFVKNNIAISAMSRGAIDGDALICVGKKTVNITGFLNNSYHEDPYEKSVSKIILVSLCLSLLGALLGLLFVGTLSAVFMIFALVLCLCCPPASLMLCNLPLKVAAKTLDDYDAAIAGFSSAVQIAESNAIAVNVLDIFPAGSVKLYKMHLLSKNAVDHSLMEAAAVAVGAKSPLGDIFKQILAGDMSNLPQVDAITYEDKMGLSGWIGERRILVGNRALMEGHDIKLPSIEIDKKILHNSFFPVYIAVEGKPCVLLVVGYEANEDITYELRRLCSTGVTLLVNSCDPNVTEQMICDYFGLFDDSVKLMSSSAIQLYKQETNYTESTKAPACFGDSICGFFAAVTASIRIKTISAIMAAIHIIGIFCGISLVIYLLSSGQFQLITSLAIVTFQLIFISVTAIVPYLKRP